MSSHFINLPPPPSDPLTPSDFGPGTPNSGLSQLSTVAIKDGHQGHAPPRLYQHTTSSSSTNTLDAERADRISRLAGLERVATLRGANQHLAQGPQQNQQQLPLGYFDNASNPHKSTVGSASASGSVGGRMTWASGSDLNDTDKMSDNNDNNDDGVSSTGMSDEGNASLVGFGEAAESNASGPTSTTGRIPSITNGALGYGKHHKRQSSSPMEGVEVQRPPAGTAGKTAPGSSNSGGRDVTMSRPEDAEKIVGDKSYGGKPDNSRPFGSPDQANGLGKFYFEGE